VKLWWLQTWPETPKAEDVDELKGAACLQEHPKHSSNVCTTLTRPTRNTTPTTKKPELDS